jgi:hypothetical protein
LIVYHRQKLDLLSPLVFPLLGEQIVYHHRLTRLQDTLEGGFEKGLMKLLHKVERFGLNLLLP